MLKNGIIKPSQSILLDKPDRTTRFCTDYRWVNAIIKADCHSISGMEDCIDRIGKVQLLYIDLRPGQICYSKDDGRAYSIGVGELGWRCGTGLKSHGTLTDWCTGKKWPVNCMTVISVWWRSKMPFQRRRKWHIPMASQGEILSRRLNYYITRWRREVS